MALTATLCGAVLRLTAFAVLLAIAPGAAADVAVPPLKARVTDLTGTLTADEQTALEGKLAAFEARKGSQIAVLMVPTTEPETVEQYAVRVEEAWKLGRKGISDGVLLVVAKNDRRLRIEVGYGLEGALNDATAKRIIAEEITPRFKQGDFYAGIDAGVNRVMRVIDGEPLPPPGARGGEGGGGSLLEHSDWLIPGFFILMVASGILRSLFGRFLGSTLLGTLAGFVIWAIIGSMFAAIVAGVIVFFFSVLGVSLPSGRGGGWSSDSGGGFGGGFSGGGGSSGGGGASGSW
ncbi:MAG: YgcG family protein [Betaproteobacteria bacterium]|nr:YgcG family protein [Betaproteobacteria bacterium]